jgi:hypothetical protein
MTRGDPVGAPAKAMSRLRGPHNHRPWPATDLVGPRDKITAELAKGDAAVLGDLQELFIKARAATRSAAVP